MVVSVVLLLLAPGIWANQLQGNQNEDSVLSCYYENWAIYKPEGSLGVVEVQDLADLATVCTHLIYAYASITTTGEIQTSDVTADLCQGDPDSVAWSHCGYQKFNNFKKDHYNLKTLIAVGGMESADTFSKVVSDETLRGKFVGSVVQFLEDHDFDGLDVNWEFPHGSDDKANLVKLLSELDMALHAKYLLLTIAVPVGISTIDSGYDIPNVSKHVDFIHVMAYDFHGSWASTTHHNSPLYKHPSDINEQLNIDSAIRHWLDSGAPADKLVLGLPMYGRCWSLNDLDNHGIGAPGTVGPNGPYSMSQGQLYYSEICKKQIEFEWTIVRDPDMEVPYAYTSSWDNTWCGYDDQESIANKVMYAHTLGLRGVMAWAVDQDDAHNECAFSNFPLTRKAKEILDNPITTASPTTDSTTTSGIRCYDCFNCPTVDGSTTIIEKSGHESCTAAIFLTNSIVIRGSTEDTHPNGECIDEGDAFTCFCTTDLCNDDSFNRELKIN